MSDSIKDFIHSNTKKLIVGAALLSSLNAQSQNLSNSKENNTLKKNKIELFKAHKNNNIQNTHISTLCKNGFFEEAYQLQRESNLEKYGYIQNTDYANKLQNIKEDIISDYQVVEGIVDEISMKDVPLDFTLKYLDENPDKKDFILKLDKKNEYLRAKNKDNKLKEISETTRSSFWEKTSEEYNSYGKNTIGFYEPAENKISLNKIGISRKNNLSKEAQQTIQAHNNMIDSAKHSKYEAQIDRILIHELEHMSQQEKGVNYSYYTKNKNEIVFDLSLEDIDRREQMKETMAEINVMLAISENYIRTGTIPENMKKDFPEYTQAIEKGIINPKDSSSKAKDKEFNFITNIATNDWNKNRKEKYSEQINKQVDEYILTIEDQISTDEQNPKFTDYQRESTPLVWGMIKQKLGRVKYRGKEINLSKFLDESKFIPTKRTKITSKNFDKYLTDLNRDLRKENKSTQPNKIQTSQKEGR